MFSGRLREIRKEKGLTQAELAQMIGVSPSSVKKWENGDVLPNIKIIASLGMALDITLDYLCGVTDVKRTLSEVSPINKRYEVFCSLPLEQQEALAKYAEYLKEGGRSV